MLCQLEALTRVSKTEHALIPGGVLIPVLPSSAWLEFRGRPTVQGQNLTTHQALIAAPDGTTHQCFVKFSPERYPMPFTESVAWLIADALDLPRPNFAAIIFVPLDRLRQSGMRLDQNWPLQGEVAGFCSSTVPGKHLTGRWNWLAALRKAKAFKHPDVARIAAFDSWVDNQDRHSGNLLKSEGDGFVPIDNELILYHLVWVASGLYYQHNSLRNEARHLLKQRGYSNFESAMVLASGSHAPALLTAWPRVASLVQAYVADATMALQFQQALHAFLTSRAAPGWLATELGQIP